MATPCLPEPAATTQATTLYLRKQPAAAQPTMPHADDSAAQSTMPHADDAAAAPDAASPTSQIVASAFQTQDEPARDQTPPEKWAAPPSIPAFLPDLTRPDPEMATPRPSAVPTEVAAPRSETAAARPPEPAFSPGGCATCACPASGCHSDWCCPKYCFTIEKPPRIEFTTVCPKPVCSPCDIEGYGYFPTCWRPWAYPPDYRHCPVPPPGVLASQAPPPGVLASPVPPLVVNPGTPDADGD